MKGKVFKFTKRNLILFVSAMLYLLGLTSMANNLQIGTPTKSNDTLFFTIAWDNSWRVSTGPSNYDGIWLFVKYQDCGGNRIWNHVNVVAAGTKGAPAIALTTTVPADNKGVFIYRSADGQGNIAATNYFFKMAAGAVGTYNYKVTGIEMVYIPQGTFDLGDGVQVNAFKNGAVVAPYSVNSTAVIAATALGATANNVQLPAGAAGVGFPKGYDPFWIMKYEISIEQYVNFLNSLTYSQQSTRIYPTLPNAASGTFPTGYPNLAGWTGIAINTPGTNNMIPAVFSSDCTAGNFDNFNDCQTSAMPNLSWPDLASYLCWAALRPMTELEFEKACRGTLPMSANEYAWGDNNLNPVTAASISNQSQTNMVSNLASLGLCNYASNLTGPYRCGMLAKATTVRNTAGTTYYGVADMSGNVREMVVGVTSGNCVGAGPTTFIGTLGTGTLDVVNGEADVATMVWPSWTPAYTPNTPVAAAYTATLGIGTRGGGWNDAVAQLRISDRNYMNTTAAGSCWLRTGAGTQTGGRGVRQP
ncbi:MAG: SUMF1/EgtB/PvdO family nonheme iron enzyme [Bacteroidota bacterium]|nr:SUMF1/EgtB/PvdO family nonheme iron enzyme [Bacteroidota bacterium]